MNKVILVGRLTRDPEVKTTQSQVEVCSFTVAVDRRFKTASGERQSDFINCVAWRQQAKLLGQYFQKGHRIGIIGSLQSRSYDDKDGKKVYVTEVTVDEIEFLESRKDGASSVSDDRSYSAPAPMSSNAGSDSVFMPTMDDDTALPFDL
ncbi:MAG: single-stranded DNA-binding protein [Clostridiaceae bacterium]|nr:single-stranded DNA-binding protein [Clostridiaceae bacterium]